MLKRWGKLQILLIAELLVILALLPGCFREEELVDAFFGEDIVGSAAQPEEQQYCGDRLSLEPGVYQVRVHTSMAEVQSMYVQMKYDQANFKALRNNGMLIFAGNDAAEFEVYVLDRVSTAYVQCDFSGCDAGRLVKLEVWRTNLGRRMLLFIIVILFAGIDFLVMFRRRILEGKATVKQQVVFWTLAAGVLIAYFPFLTDYFFIGADSVFHLERIACLADTLEAGNSIPVRIEGTWMYGHGYAASLFYGNFFLYLPAFLHMIGFSIMNAYKMFVFLVLAATAVIAYYSFKRCVKNEYAALFGSMVYLLTPYHLLNIYNWGAAGEYLAMTFLPLVYCGMYLLYTEDVEAREYRKYKWYVVWGMSAILQSHLISAEMTAAVMLVFCVIYWKKTFQKKTFCQLLEATGIVLVINAWFWQPMLYMLATDSYHLQEIISENGQSRGVLFAALFQFLPNKGGAQTGMWQCEPAQAGAGAVMILLIGGIWGYYRKRQGKKEGSLAPALAGLLLIFMSTRYFPWDYIPWDAMIELPGIGRFVGSLQFPTCWMSPATVFVSFYAACIFGRIREKGGIGARASMAAAAVVVVFSAVYHVNDIVNVSNPVWLYNAENMGSTGVMNGEYLLEGTAVSDFYFHKPAAEEGLVWYDYEQNGTDAALTLNNTSDTIRFIELPLTGYKGYGIEASDSGGKTPYITEERGKHGDIRIAVPGNYSGSITVSYQGFALFRVAEVISLAGIAALLVLRFTGKKLLDR